MGLSHTSLTRRSVLTVGAGAAASTLLWRQPARAGAPAVEQVHLQFGADAASEMTVSWASASSVSRPRVRLGTATGGYGSTVAAQTRTYVDAASKVETWTHHAHLTGLRPATHYVYEALQDGGATVSGSFTTGPRGRAPFRFTSFGDQTTGDPSDPLGTPFGSYVVDQVERMNPLFHLLNGDLCYANFNGYLPGVSPYGQRQDIWRRFFANTQRSAMNRPWMPAAGNHENELGNGPQGFSSYATRFALPSNGIKDFANYWYDFTVGSVKVISLQNDDVCYQDAGNSYIRGYSQGAQRKWLERTLQKARADHGIDWIVVAMHQLAMSSATTGNGSDLGIREQWMPLFDEYGVDLVLCGHDHDYERTHPVRGVVKGSDLLTPAVAHRGGAVHLTLGGGGTALPSAFASSALPGTPMATVNVAKGKTEKEVAEWSAVRDVDYPYGFATIDVDPGNHPGGMTSLSVVYYRTPPSSLLPPIEFDRFTLSKQRSDALTHQVA